MEKLLYFKTYSTYTMSRVLCTNKAFREELEYLLKDFPKIRVRQFEQTDSVVIDIVSFAYVDWCEIYTLLKEHGYIFTPRVEKEYTYLLQRRLLKEEKGEKKEFNEATEDILIKKPKYKTVYLCAKYDCETSLAYCEKCWYRRKLQDCKPIEKRIKVEE